MDTPGRVEPLSGRPGAGEDVAAVVRRTLPAEPSRKSVRYHAFIVTLSWTVIGIVVAVLGASVDYPILLAIGGVQLFALLIHTSSKTIDLDRWIMSATQIAEKYAEGGRR